MTRTIISLYDYTGNWSSPYRDAGYEVIQVDIKLGTDIYDFEPRNAHGVLAAPPCTDFAGSGAQWWRAKNHDGRTAESVRLMKRTLEVINLCNPEWWALENPVGRLNRLLPELQEYGPTYYQPYWYGDPISKKTGIWGTCTVPEPTNIVAPEGMRPGQPPAWYSKVGGASEATKEYRSATSMGFARAFFAANP